jgi:uncharacterized protein YukE
MELPGEIGRGVSAAFAQLDSATANLTSGTFTVNKDNVLAAAKIIQSQAEALDDKLRDARRELRIEPPGGDDVSVRIAPAWNDVLLQKPDSYANRIQQYVDGLRKLAQQCADSAKAYGYTDDQIAAAFGGQVV